MTQADLGDRAGMHRTHVGHVERGVVDISYLRVRAIANALDVKPAELFRRGQPARPAPDRSGGSPGSADNAS